MNRKLLHGLLCVNSVLVLAVSTYLFLKYERKEEGDV
jgi:hypothetical protein